MLVSTLLEFALGYALFASTSTSHSFDSRFADTLPNYESFRDNVYARHPNENDSFHDAVYARPIDAKPELRVRGLYNLAGNDQSDETILGQGFLDMVALVTYVAANPNAAVMARYFSPNDAADVTAIFHTVEQMAAPGGFPNPPNGVRPTDLSQIAMSRASGGIPDLAESFDTSSTSTNPEIKIYDFGWSALWQRLRQSLQCSRDIGPNTNYKMHFLGSLMLHETLHFNNVAFLAWNTVLPQDQYPDDQPGNFPCTNKAYGPYEAISLNQRNSALAKINIENYVWYALETYWLNQCPGSASGGMFTAPKSNDIPSVCKQGLKGALSNLWCWAS